jgi:protein O-mannosyl-transferase
LGIAILTIVHLRLSIPGPITQFSTADNPTAKESSLMARFYTFTYLPVFNFKMLIYPHTLSFDWGMDAIPRITSLFDSRNLASLMFYSAMIRIIYKSYNALRRGAIKSTNMIRGHNKLGRSIQNRKHVIHFSAAVNDAMSSNMQSNQLYDNGNNSCSKCKHCGLISSTSSKYPRHSSNDSNRNCRINNSVGFTAASLCSASNGGNGKKKQVLSLSPLKKYIRNNNLYSSCSNCLCEYSRDNNNNNVNFYERSCSNLSSSTTSSFSYQQQQQHQQQQQQQQQQYSNKQHQYQMNGHCVKSSVKNLSNKFESFVDQIQSAEESIKQSTKLHWASATLLSITILILPFLPASNMFFYVGFVVAERILYLPSVGYCLLIGLGLGKLINFNVHLNKSKASNSTKMRQHQKLDKHRHHNDVRSIAIIVFLIILISGCSFKTMLRNQDWRDEESLYRSAIKVNPPKGKLKSILKKVNVEMCCFSLFSPFSFQNDHHHQHHH